MNNKLPDLPDLYLPPPKYTPPSSSLSRPSANNINGAGTRVQEITVSLPGYDETIPLVYGEDRMAGLWLVRPYTHILSGELRFAILWSWGGEEGIEGIQTIVANGAALPGAVTVTHYLGTPTQGVDPTLAADIPGFSDNYAYAAYSVFRVPPDTIEGFPQSHQIEVVIRGIKVYDERTGLTEYSENPALCMADFITRPEAIGGVGKQVFNVTPCADRCDQDLGGQERCKLGLTIKEADFLNNMLDLFAVYSEVLWQYEAGGVLIVPDAPVDSPAETLTTDNFDFDSVQFLGNDMRQSPTMVTVDYRKPSGTVASWTQEPAIQKLPGVDEGIVENVPSDIFLPGIHRASEANRKALMRLRRLSYPSRFAFMVFDEGIKYQRGDVVQLPDTRGLISRQVRILSKEQVSPGRYQLTAEHYDANMYPDDYDPGTTTDWPVGTGIFFTGSEIPSGWERNEDADGYMLFGSSDTYPAGTKVGDGNIALSGTTSLNGGHTGQNNDGSGNAWIRGSSGGGSGDFNYNGAEPDHDHTYSLISPATRIPYNRREIIIVKTGTSGEIPVGGQIFANGLLISAVLTEVASYLGYFASAGNALSTGQSHPFLIGASSVTFSAEPDHNHASGSVNGNFTPTFGPPAYSHVTAGGHSHGANFNVTLSVKRMGMAFYQANALAAAQIGAIAMYFGDVGDLTGTGFHVCDGDNGTVDLTDHFILRSSSANAGVSSGDHTCSWTAVTNTVPDHDHEGNLTGNLTARLGYHKNPAGSHNHSANGTASYRPPGYSVIFIQYTGVV